MSDPIAEPVTQKRKKERKPQTEEEYQKEKQIFATTGPTLNTQDWLYEAMEKDQLDESIKHERLIVLHACEKSYYSRDYVRCLELITKGLQIFGVDDDSTIEDKKKEFKGRKIAKTAKIEKHILELLYIREKCLEKIQGNEIQIS